MLEGSAITTRGKQILIVVDTAILFNSCEKVAYPRFKSLCINSIVYRFVRCTAVGYSSVLDWTVLAFEVRPDHSKHLAHTQAGLCNTGENLFKFCSVVVPCFFEVYFPNFLCCADTENVHNLLVLVCTVQVKIARHFLLFLDTFYVLTNVFKIGSF